MENRLIKNFCFIESERPNLTLSDDTLIRLNTENKADQKIMLKTNILDKFSTDADIHVETALIEANALINWLNFEVVFRAGDEPLTLPVGTSLGFKVKTSGDDYFWNGSAWAVAGASDWSTESQINVNLPTFPIITVGDKKIGFKVNLVTTDPLVTPEVFELKLLGLFDVEYFDDLVYDSLIRLLNINLRSTSVLRVNTGTSIISTIDLDSVLENKGYNIFDVKKVYNLSDDPLKLTNLHGSYATGTPRQDGFTFNHGIETFTGPIPADKVIEIIFEYVPEISVKVNQDYFEVPSYPHIILHRITPVERRGFMMRNNNGVTPDFIRDKDNDMATKHVSPSQNSYRFDFTVHTTEIDQFRLLDTIRAFFANTKELITFGLGNKHNIELVEEIDTVGNKESDSSDTNMATGSFDILGVLFFDQPSIDVPLVGALTINAGRQT